MSDLIVPIVMMVVMFLLIDSIDNWILLVLFGLMFIPLSFMFMYQVGNGTYTALFGADISAYAGDVPGFDTMLQMLIWFIPILAFAKLYIIKRVGSLGTEEVEDGFL